MNAIVLAIPTLLSLMLTPQAKAIPTELWGKWVVSRVLPTSSIACWGGSEAKMLLGTEIEYSTNLFRWKDVITRRPTASIEVISAERFQAEYSGRGRDSSLVTFEQLGLYVTEATHISITHPPAEITSGTVEIPGDNILLKDKNTIIVSVCGVYFEARRSKKK